MLTESSFDTGEVVINYAEGPALGSPLVLLHGSTLDWQSWQHLIPPLAQTWHAYACDLRGHGKSGWASSGYRIIDFVPDTAAFVERHLGQPTVLIGLSTGALVALGVAAQLPKLVRAIVLLDPGLILRNSSFSTIAFSDAYDWLTWVNATLTSAHTLEEVLARCKEQMPDEAEAQSRAKMLHSLDPQSVAVILNDQFYGGLDLEQVLRQVACPTLLLCGEPERGGLIRDSDVDFFQSNVPQSTVIRIKDAGHGLIFEQPAKVLERVSGFLSSL